jgi:hypothetical protein
MTIALVGFAIIALTGLDTFRSKSFVRRVKSIKVGDSNEQVVAALGRATEVFLPPKKVPSGWYLGVRVETWAYGRRFDWQHCFYSEFPYFFPFKVRLFGPEADDIEVEFDSAGRVSRVRTP